VLKVYSKTKIIPATNDPSASCLSLENTFSGTSEFFPEVLGCSQVSLLNSPVPRGSWIQPGGSGLSKVTVADLYLRVFIPPCLPTVFFFHSCAKTVAFAPHLSQALTPTHLNPNPTLAFKRGVIPYEKKQI
jgi:hypothetical protein